MLMTSRKDIHFITPLPPAASYLGKKNQKKIRVSLLAGFKIINSIRCTSHESSKRENMGLCLPLDLAPPGDEDVESMTDG
jgi:hypothetical protein